MLSSPLLSYEWPFDFQTYFMGKEGDDEQRNCFSIHPYYLFDMT